jgi:hypothetical protein
MEWAAIITAGMAVAIGEASSAALYATMATPAVRFPAGTPSRTAAKAGERRAQLALLRCIFGNPYRTVAVESAWLAWGGGVVVKLAHALYDERRFEDLPILADALEEAGCTEPVVLDHCRSGGEHARGCWVVDSLLGKCRPADSESAARPF